MMLSGLPCPARGTIAEVVWRHRFLLLGAANRLANGTRHHVTRHVATARQRLNHPLVAIVASAFLWLAILAADALLLASAANAQSSHDVYDNHGRRVLTVRPDNAGNLDIRGLDGRRKFTVKPDALGGSRVEDTRGRTIERVQPADAMGGLCIDTGEPSDGGDD